MTSRSITQYLSEGSNSALIPTLHRWSFAMLSSTCCIIDKPSSPRFHKIVHNERLSKCVLVQLNCSAIPFWPTIVDTNQQK